MNKEIKKWLAIITGSSVLMLGFSFPFEVYALSGITFDAVSAASSSGTAATSVTFSHTATTTDDVTIVVMVCTAGGLATSTVTYAGNTVTERERQNHSVNVESLSIFTATTTNTGANDVVVTFGASTNFRVVAMTVASTTGAIDFSNIRDEGSPVGGASFGDGATTTVTTMMISSGMLGNADLDVSYISALSGQTEAGNGVTDTNSRSCGFGYRVMTASTSQNLWWKNNDISSRRGLWGVVALTEGVQPDAPEVSSARYVAKLGSRSRFRGGLR